MTRCVRPHLVFFSLCTAATALPAAALDWGLDGRLGAVYSDNIAQAPQPLADSTEIGTVELHGVAQHDSRALTLDVEANHSYRHFFDDTYDAEHRSQFRGAVDWLPLGDWLTLSVSDVYGQLSLDPSEGLLPTQYQNANVLATGPTIAVPMGEFTRLTLNGEYRDATFEHSPSDSSRTYGAATLARQMSRLLTIYATASTARVEFSGLGPSRDYDVRSGEAGMNLVGRRTSLALSAGVDRLDDGDNGFNGGRYELTFERSLSKNARLFASARREITDSAQVFNLGQITDPSLSIIRDVQVTPQPLVRAQYRLGWGWSGGSLDLNLHGAYTTERYRQDVSAAPVALGLDRDVKDVTGGATYHISSNSSFRLTADFQEERFDSGAESNNLWLKATFQKGLAHKLSLELTAQKFERDRSSRDFNELRFLVLLHYSLHEMAERPDALFDRAFERRTVHLRDRGSERIPGALTAPED